MAYSDVQQAQLPHLAPYQHPIQPHQEPKPPVSAAVIASPPRPASPIPSSHPSYMSPKTEFVLDWALKVLGVAAAVLFGIWAPISYKATADGNSGNDASQQELASRIDNLATMASAMSREAVTAVALQSEASSSLKEVKSKMDQVGSLRVWEFCESRTDEAAVCEEIVTSMFIENVISSLAGLPFPTITIGDSYSSPLATPTRTSSTGTKTTGSGLPLSTEKASGKKRANLALPAILGIVFGALALVGAVMGCAVWSYRVKKGERERTRRYN